jgi:putative transposase
MLDVKKRISITRSSDSLGRPMVGSARKSCLASIDPRASNYLWRNKFGGLDVSDTPHLEALEADNARLKKLLAETLLENEVTKEALRNKWWLRRRSMNWYSGC